MGKKAWIYFTVTITTSIFSYQVFTADKGDSGEKAYHSRSNDEKNDDIGEMAPKGNIGHHTEDANSNTKKISNCREVEWQDMEFDMDREEMKSKLLQEKLRSFLLSNPEISVSTLHFAIQNGDLIASDIAEMIKEDSFRYTALNIRDKTSKDSEQAHLIIRKLQRFKTVKQLIEGIESGDIDADTMPSHGRSLITWAAFTYDEFGNKDIQTLLKAGVDFVPQDISIFLHKKQLDIKLFKQNMAAETFKQWLAQPHNVYRILIYTMQDEENAILRYLQENKLLSVRDVSFGTLADELVKLSLQEPELVLKKMQFLAKNNIYPTQVSLEYLESERYRRNVEMFIRHESNLDNSSSVKNYDSVTDKNLLYKQIEEFVAVNARVVEFTPPKRLKDEIDTVRKNLNSISSEVENSMQNIGQKDNSLDNSSPLTDPQLALCSKKLESLGFSNKEIDRVLAEHSKRYVRMRRLDKINSEMQKYLGSLQLEQKDLETLDKFRQFFRSTGSERLEKLEQAFSKGDLTPDELRRAPVAHRVLHRLLIVDDFDTIRLLVKYGLNSDMIGQVYTSKLRASELTPASLQQLETMGVNLNQRDLAGKNKFYDAILSNNLAVAKYLYDNGIEIDPDPYDIDALDVALRENNQEAVAFLMEIKFPLKTSHKQQLQEMLSQNESVGNELLERFPRLAEVM